MLKNTLVIVCFSLIVESHCASFNCAKASTKVEHLICNIPVLSQLDENMAFSYRSALKGENSSIVKLEHKQFLKSLKNCTDSSCISELMLARINTLQDVNQVNSGNPHSIESPKSPEESKPSVDSTVSKNDNNDNRHSYSESQPSTKRDIDKKSSSFMSLASISYTILLLLALALLIFTINWCYGKVVKMKIFSKTEGEHSNQPINYTKLSNGANVTSQDGTENSKFHWNINTVASLIVSIFGFCAALSSVLISLTPVAASLLVALISINAFMAASFLPALGVICIPTAIVSIVLSTISLLIRRNKLALISIAMSTFAIVFSLGISSAIIALFSR